MDYMRESLLAHARWRGKLSVEAKAPVANAHDLSLAYTPGVAAPCLEIQKDIGQSFLLTGRWNTVAVVTDGSAVLGLGDIGPEAGMPVMEGKCVLFKTFGGVDALPLCVRSRDVEEIVRTVSLLQGSFGGVNLEDISAPRCFEIETRLKAVCDIPIFHDDQHGTAIVVLAALINALKVAGKPFAQAKVAVNGAGAAGTAVARLLLASGVGEVLVCDSRGILSPGRQGMNEAKEALAAVTNPGGKEGALADAVRGADVFVGVSVPGVLTGGMVETMARDAVVFACANPVPEIYPDEARAHGALVCATGRSDMPNQLNNVLAFPGVFRGALDVRASDISDGMKTAAALALAALAAEDGLRPDNILPKPFDARVCPAVAAAVAAEARRSGLARELPNAALS